MTEKTNNFMSSDVKEWQMEALTDIWTGDVNRKPDRLITTGLLGSIRWWFEVFARGLGGSACDPSDTKCEGRNHCVVCELFGCTGWARKFRFEVLDKNGNIRETQNNAKTKISPQIKKNEEFRLRFTPLRPIGGKEWALLDVTLRLIANYGAIGGKTVLKPSEQNSRDQHKDYGLIKSDKPQKINISRDVLQEYISQNTWRKLNHSEFAWASLKHFWCVNGKYLAREQNDNSSSFNRIIGRPDPKHQSNENDSWIAGRRPDKTKGIVPESKKVFSFKNPPKTFGFVEKDDLQHWNGIKDSLNKLKKEIIQWRDFQLENDLLTKNRILENLFRSKWEA